MLSVLLQGQLLNDPKKLKIRAAQERTTVGELVERWIEGWK